MNAALQKECSGYYGYQWAATEVYSSTYTSYYWVSIITLL